MKFHTRRAIVGKLPHLHQLYTSSAIFLFSNADWNVLEEVPLMRTLSCQFLYTAWHGMARPEASIEGRGVSLVAKRTTQHVNVRSMGMLSAISTAPWWICKPVFLYYFYNLFILIFVCFFQGFVWNQFRFALAIFNIRYLFFYVQFFLMIRVFVDWSIDA